MAALVLAMLFIGVGMVASLSATITRWSRSIGRWASLILILVVIRLRQPAAQPAAAVARQHAGLAAPGGAWPRTIVLYALMFALPLVGWGMLSAAGYPIVLYGSLAAAADPAARRHALRGAAPAPHLSGLPAVRDHPRPSRRRADARPDLPRRRVRQHAALAGADEERAAGGGRCAGPGGSRPA